MSSLITLCPYPVRIQFSRLSRAIKHDQKTRIIAIVTIAFLCFLYLLPSNPISSIASGHSSSTCDFTSALENVFVMVKTGACEDRQKLITQLQTSLKCVPLKAYWSDLDEKFAGVHLQDAFGGGAVDQKYLDNADEFKLYKKLREVGSCEKLDTTDLVSSSAFGTENNGNFASRGWALDKWKYLPMIEKAWKLHNKAKWYMEIETDTYVWQ